MITYNLTHINRLRFELSGERAEHKVKFVNKSTKEVIYETNMNRNTWAELTHEYLIDVDIKMYKGDKFVRTINLIEHLKGKRVFISFESESLGDSIAWIPYCLEFKKKYDCEVIVSTFMNHLFESVYPELTFVGRAVVVHNIVAKFEIGWHFNPRREPTHPATIPLQQAATNILNLPFVEIPPRIAFTPQIRPIQTKYVCISTQSTSQLKLWYYWQDLVDWLVSQNYQVVEVSKGETDLKNCVPIEDKSLPSIMNYLHHAEFFIGLSSGISWLSWALNKKVFMIANFSTPDHEFQSNCIRITNPNVCNGCWNNPKFRFNKGDWNYCPEHEDTPNAFVCHKSITVNVVVNEIKRAGF